jgi:hypothetical protein
MLLSGLVLRVIGHLSCVHEAVAYLILILSQCSHLVLSHIPLLRMLFYFSNIIGRFINFQLFLKSLCTSSQPQPYTQYNNVKIDAQLIHCPTRVSMLIDRS